MTLDTALTILSLVIGAWAGYRMLGRAVRVVWARFVSGVLAQQAWAWVVAWGAPPEDYVTSGARWPGAERDHGSQRSYHAEPDREPSGTAVQEQVPTLRERLERLDDDAMTALLASLKTPDGSWRYAESRIGKFAPGRLEDRIEQVRRIRGTDPAPKPAAPTTPYAGRPYDPTHYEHEVTV